MATCTQIEQWQQAYIDDDLSASQRVILEEHVGTCRTCRHSLRRQQQVNALLFETFAEYRLGRDLSKSVLEHLPEMEFPAMDVDSVNLRAKHPMRVRERLVRLVPLAAVILLFVLGLVIRDNWPAPSVPYHAVGMVTHSEGGVFSVRDRSGAVRKSQHEDYVTKGERLTTDSSGRMVISLSGPANVKMNRDTAVIVHDERKVTVERGQAYFEVEEGRGAFRVFTPTGDVAVYGTSFDVQVTPDVTRVVLAHGSVRVGHNEFSSAFAVLRPNEQVEVVRGIETMTPRPANVPSLTAWQRDLAPRESVYALFQSRMQPRLEAERVAADLEFIVRNVKDRLIENVIVMWEPRAGLQDFCGYEILVFTEHDVPLFKGTIDGRVFADPSRNFYMIQNTAGVRADTRNAYVTIEPQCGSSETEMQVKVDVTLRMEP